MNDLFARRRSTRAPDRSCTRCVELQTPVQYAAWDRESDAHHPCRKTEILGAAPTTLEAHVGRGGGDGREWWRCHRPAEPRPKFGEVAMLDRKTFTSLYQQYTGV